MAGYNHYGDPDTNDAAASATAEPCTPPLPRLPPPPSASLRLPPPEDRADNSNSNNAGSVGSPGAAAGTPGTTLIIGIVAGIGGLVLVLAAGLLVYRRSKLRGTTSAPYHGPHAAGKQQPDAAITMGLPDVGPFKPLSTMQWTGADGGMPYSDSNASGGAYGDSHLGAGSTMGPLTGPTVIARI
jgi:hypothetical protein